MNKDYFLFTWDAIPGKDSKKLLDHLEKGLKIAWVTNAEIQKSDEDKTITVTDRKNSLKLILENTVILELDDEEICEYVVKRENGRLGIYHNEVLPILRELDPEDDEGLEQLAAMTTKRAWKDPRAIVNCLHSDDEDEASKARAVLLDVGDIALTPLLDALSPTVPEDYVWDVETMVNIQMENRLKIAKTLENMLEDKRPREMPELPPSTEETYVPRRVCDEAYLLMCRLLAFEEVEEEQFFNADEFLDMTDEEKDAEIRRAKTSRRWIPLTEQFYEVEESSEY